MLPKNFIKSGHLHHPQRYSDTWHPHSPLWHCQVPYRAKADTN